MISYFLEALRVLNANRTRSFLTALGLIIGVMAVISIQVLGAGMAGAVGGVLGSVSDQSFVVFPSNQQADFTRAALHPDDIEKAKHVIPHIIEAIPAGGINRQVRAGHDHARLTIIGESDQRFFTNPLSAGQFLAPADIASAAHAAVITAATQEKLFPGMSPADTIGQSFRIGEHRYVVSGVQEKPVSGVLPSIVRGDILIPYTTYERDFLRGRIVIGGRFLVDDPQNIQVAEDATIVYLSALKKGRAQYQAFDRKTFAKSVDGIFNGLTFVVALIGAVSLVVAGIGILNIMLVSVAERTREIGLRKAIGATRFQILLQFFIEALLLSSIGCGIGLVLGLLIGGLVNTFAIVKVSGVVAPIPWLRATLIATGFATLVTLAFGTYPAYRAARLDPIESLRYE